MRLGSSYRKSENRNQIFDYRGLDCSLEGE